MTLQTPQSLNTMNASLRIRRRVFRDLLYHLYSIWLFTFSDLKNILFPQTLFGILTALSTFKSGTTTSGTSDASQILYRTPMVMFWVWIHLLPIDIHNQQQPNAIAEDQVNKPWRPLPSNRCTLTQARCAMFLFYSIATLTSYKTGPFRWSISIMVLGIWHNTLGGSDANPFVRNFIVTLAYASFGLGALEIAQNESLSFGSRGGSIQSNFPPFGAWIIILSLVIITTIHVQDMEDQEGDILRGRQSLPLQIGDGPTRWVYKG